MDKVPLWRDKEHVSIRQLVEDFGRYTYLPRLQDPEGLLLESIRNGISLVTWQQETFAYADGTSAPPGRFHGSVALNPERVGRDAGQVADEVVAQLVGLVGADVKVTLEIEAEVPTGVPDNVVRTVNENSRQLKFTVHGFERE